MCPDCWNRHRLTHSQQAEFTCDGCGGPLNGKHPDGTHFWAPGGTEQTLQVSVGRGRKIVVRHLIYLGWGWCTDCEVNRLVMELVA